MRPWHFVAWAQIQMEDKDWRALADRSLCGLALIIPRPKYTVVNSGLRPYKNTVGQRHRTRPQILCRPGPAYPIVAQAPQLQPGRHDFLRLYRPLLAAD